MAFGIAALRAEMHRRFDGLERILKLMAGSIADLDAQLDAFEAAADAADQVEQAATAEIQAVVNDILAKVGPTVDVSAEIARLQAAQQKRSDASAKLKAAADAIQAQDTPPPPPTPPTP